MSHKITLVYEYTLFLPLAISIFATGCSTAVWNKGVDWGIRPDHETFIQDAFDKRMEQNKALEDMYLGHPEWRNNILNSEFIVHFYDSSGRPNGSAIIK